MKQKLHKSYIFIYISSAKHTHTEKQMKKNTNKTVNCNKKNLLLLIYYTHTKTHKKIFSRQQMPTQQATDSSVSFPFTNTHTYAKPLSCKCQKSEN